MVRKCEFCSNHSPSLVNTNSFCPTESCDYDLCSICLGYYFYIPVKLLENSSVIFKCPSPQCLTLIPRETWKEINQTSVGCRTEIQENSFELSQRNACNLALISYYESTKGDTNFISSLSLSNYHSPRLPSSLFSGLYMSLVTLDISRNELLELPPAIGRLTALNVLNLSRNFLKKLPLEIGQLTKLRSLDISSNRFRPSTDLHRLLRSLPLLKFVDLRYNNMIVEKPDLGDIECLFSLRVPKGDKLHAADRDATLLRSQMEPHSTGTLRRRLALVFKDTTDPDVVDREEVMDRLIEHYNMRPPREIRHIKGAPVDAAICSDLLKELELWVEQDKFRMHPRERLTIRAAHYMILTGPAAFAKETSSKAVKAKEKLAKYPRLWELAHKAVTDTDPEFAQKYTAVAFTKNFEGSPHIDTQNIATFRGLSLGDFSEGGGKLAVECSALEVAHLDTRNRLGKLDGRFPHWVTPYEDGDRYSVIYYITRGEIELRTTAVFEGESLAPDDPATYSLPGDNYYNKYNRATNVYSPSK